MHVVGKRGLLAGKSGPRMTTPSGDSTPGICLRGILEINGS